jgi:uracil-DNA glycosylase
LALAARDEARRLLDLSTATVYLLCGARVREAFGGPRFYEAERRGSKFLLSLPHPSGLNRMWNDPKARRRVRAACRAVAPWVAWGGYDEL